MKNYIFLFIALCFCMVMTPDVAQAVIKPAEKKENVRKGYQDMDRAEKKAFRKELRKTLKTAKKERSNNPDRINLDFSNYQAIGISLSILGIAGILVGWLLGIGIFYGLGSLLLTIGLVILILYWLDVI